MAQNHAATRITTAPATWLAVQELFGTKGEPSRCWCRWFALTAKDWAGSSPGDRKESLRSAFQTGPAPGVLAFRDDSPVGWCAVEPRQNYPRLKRSKVLRAADTGVEDKGSVWSVSCFVVAARHRRTGVSTALLAAAVDHAFDHGADVLEAYPVDTDQRARATASELFHGTLSVFTAAGFIAVSESVPGRPVVRLQKRKAGSREQ